MRTSHEIFIEPPDANIVLTDEDSGDEDGGGTLDNLPGSQLRAEAEIILADNTRIGGGSTKTIPNPSDKPLFSKPSTSSQCTELSVPDWIHGDIETPNHKFPEHNHEQYKGLSPTELFEKFFDEEIILLLLQETSKYALFLNCPHPKISVEELKCFIGILILSGYNTLPGKRCYWDSQDDMRNTMIYIDNLFTGTKLLTHLRHHGYHGTGTIPLNRIPRDCPLTNKKVMEKKARGTYESILDRENGIIYIRWVDNGVVTVASTLHGVKPLGNVRRYSQAEKKIVQVGRPNIIAKYNSFMGGTDLMDENIARYRIGIRGKKWWWYLFSWVVDICVHNSWQIHRKAGVSVRFQKGPGRFLASAASSDSRPIGSIACFTIMGPWIKP
ncbi:hypothetical protein NQ314_012715 [Rhamnusium bicolor]|uniref:PiggyBac transposable element-derived protein domain-containing protein n=1 Tax=Rhamnusium bicolor TaxID=1586634 RepID=A0AAV8XB06_9CUCU|nr:hypothetical protein NQ314_012715 [Rhamnusium bicolor]